MSKRYTEYKLIKQFYGTQCAKRSNVPLINHIDEGLYILDKMCASDYAKRAYCLHPMLQADKDLEANFDYVVTKSDSITIALAMEYRNIANQWLSDKVRIEDGLMPCVTYDQKPKLSPLYGVTQMLRADKIQNYKDFLLYHKDSHARTVELHKYFEVWLDVLNVDFPKWMEDLVAFSPPLVK
jgi:hypothetical protein